MASLFTRKGTYYISFFDQYEEPKRKQLSLHTKDKRQANRRLLDLEDAFENGAFDPWRDSIQSFIEGNTASENITCEHAKARFVAAKRKEECSPNTIRTYSGIIGRFVNEVNPKRPIGEIRESHISRYVRKESLAQSTKRKRYRHLSVWFNWLVRHELLNESPMRKMKAPKSGNKLPKALRMGEMDTLCKASPKWFSRLVRFAVYTGLRSSELGRLKFEHVDLDSGLIRIYEQKNGSEQTIPLVPKAEAILKEIGCSKATQPEHSGYVFNQRKLKIRRWVQFVSRTFRKYADQSELRRELSFHSTRHATATVLAEAGKSAVVIKEFMRHSHISTSMTYTHIARKRLSAEVESVF